MNRKLWMINGVLMGMILAQAVDAFGQALPTVAPDTNWAWVGIAVACVFLIAGAIWWLRDRPGAVATAKAETSSVQAGFETIAHRLSESLHTLTNTHAEAVAAIPIALAATPPAAAPPAAVPAAGLAGLPIGKNATSGTFTIDVTGDPKADLAAMQAQYFG